MTIYLDLVFLLNFFFDFFLLLTVNVALKRYASFLKLFLGSLIGSLSMLFLFIPLGSITLIFLKFLLALIMVLLTFGYKNIKYTAFNLLYFYMCSIILGGFLYYLKLEFSNQFYFFLLLLAPIILYVYLKSLKALQSIKNYYYHLTIVFKNNYSLTCASFLDTGNKLKDPITNKPIIIINRKMIKGKIPIRSPMYVPYNSLNNHGLLECIKPKFISINNQKLTNYLIGLSDNSFKLNGIDCLLNYQILEDIQ